MQGCNKPLAPSGWPGEQPPAVRTVGVEVLAYAHSYSIITAFLDEPLVAFRTGLGLTLDSQCIVEVWLNMSVSCGGLAPDTKPSQ